MALRWRALADELAPYFEGERHRWSDIWTWPATQGHNRAEVINAIAHLELTCRIMWVWDEDHISIDDKRCDNLTGWWAGRGCFVRSAAPPSKFPERKKTA